jgi:formiminotetrahydrofolate cyclodeaminase
MIHAEMPVNVFLEKLAAKQPAPGGGSASALGGALGVALGSMAAAYTIGSEKYKSFDSAAREVHQKLESLRAEMLLLMEADIAAYEGYRAALALPKNSDDEKRLRSAALNDAREASTAVPEKILSAALNGLEQVHALADAVNPQLAGDVASSAYFLEACARGAAIQVFSNCAGADHDGTNLRRRIAADALVEKGQALREKIHAAVLGLLKLA